MSKVVSTYPLGQTGLYGKMRSQGDFVSRRMPADFIDTWDAWLQAGLSDSRSVLGSRWEQFYKAAPVWRFVLAPGVCGTGAWTGILQPSVDRVDRYFPLTVAAGISDRFDAFATFMRCSNWYESLESSATAARDAMTTIDEFDRRVAQIQLPAECTVSLEESANATLPINVSSFRNVDQQTGANTGADPLYTLLCRNFVKLQTAACAWLTRGAESVVPSLLIANALPTPRQFCALLAGQSDVDGWDVVDRIS